MICRLLFERLVLFALSLYVLFTTAYVFIMTALNIYFIMNLHSDPLDFIAFFAFWIIAILHYIFNLICMTSTFKATRYTNALALYLHLPFYKRIRDCPKYLKLISIMVHFCFLTYATFILQIYYDPKAHNVYSNYNTSQ